MCNESIESFCRPNHRMFLCIQCYTYSRGSAPSSLPSWHDATRDMIQTSFATTLLLKRGIKE